MRMLVRVSWRDRDYYQYVRRALRGTLGRSDFQIVHVSIQDTHLHLLVEAADRKALTRGMQSFNIRLARIVHAEQGGVGKVFKYRYHATQIRTASHARHALAYVLNNWRRHWLDVENVTAAEDKARSVLVRDQLLRVGNRARFACRRILHAVARGGSADRVARRGLDGVRPDRYLGTTGPDPRPSDRVVRRRVEAGVCMRCDSATERTRKFHIE